jgi:1,3-beta-glucan synthase
MTTCSPDCQNRIDPIPEELHLRAVIRPLYRLIRDQGYESVDGKFLRRERDRDQLFWYQRALLTLRLRLQIRYV